MELGSEDYQFKDSYFIMIDPFLYILIGFFIIISAITFIIVKKRKKRKTQ